MFELDPRDLPAMKASGAIPPGAVLRFVPPPPSMPPSMADIQPAGGPKSGASCDCWIEPDSTYTPILYWGSLNNSGDDGSSGPYVLPFQFDLYGRLFSSVFININGNLTFDAAYGTYSAQAFPMNGVAMVAPFWADVDLRANWLSGVNHVYYKRTPTALYVNWVNVGYYDRQTDKLNTFQLIITNGEDPVIGMGNNVSFCYRDMQWTTGQASCSGSGSTTCGNDRFSCNNSNGLGLGFCGFPATVGANLGNGTDFIQFGRFDHPGSDFDGPFGQADGVDYLDGQNYRFNTAVSFTNVPPIVSSSVICDTIRVCNGGLIDIDVTFLTPEPDQRIVSASSDAPTLPSYAETVTDQGGSYTFHSRFSPTASEVGYHIITYTASDNGEPAMSNSVSVVVEVIHTEAVPPVITNAGPDALCPGEEVTLSASGGFNTYSWNNGTTGPQNTVGPGTHIVLGAIDACLLASNMITIDALPAPAPVITGVLVECDGEPAVLRTTGTYDQYAWSNGSSDPTITVGAGSYHVTVTNSDGCSTTSPVVTISSSTGPSAQFTVTPPNPVPLGDSVSFVRNTHPVPVNGINWELNGAAVATGTGAFDFLPDEPGIYTVTLIVTTPGGCTDTSRYAILVQPDDIIAPNVFSPNSDGSNDQLVFTGLEYLGPAALRIFNRWGQVIHSDPNYKNQWRAEGVPEGTYYYELLLPNGKAHHGHLTLLR